MIVRVQNIFLSIAISGRNVKFFVDNLYPSDYIAAVFLKPVYLRPGTDGSRLFFDFFLKGGDYNGLHND